MGCITLENSERGGKFCIGELKISVCDISSMVLSRMTRREVLIDQFQ
jgi:uncharacterized protein (DUF433 family)